MLKTTRDIVLTAQRTLVVYRANPLLVLIVNPAGLNI